MALYPGPQPRPDINEKLAEERHAEERERARQASVANEANPSWWRRLKAKLSGHSPDSA